MDSSSKQYFRKQCLTVSITFEVSDASSGGRRSSVRFSPLTFSRTSSLSELTIILEKTPDSIALSIVC